MDGSRGILNSGLGENYRSLRFFLFEKINNNECNHHQKQSDPNNESGIHMWLAYNL